VVDLDDGGAGKEGARCGEPVALMFRFDRVGEVDVHFGVGWGAWGYQTDDRIFSYSGLVLDPNFLWLR